jgi:Zn-dependent protease with chaperone function
MALEPAVENCIIEHRKRARKKKVRLIVLISIPLSALILAAAIAFIPSPLHTTTSLGGSDQSFKAILIMFVVDIGAWDLVFTGWVATAAKKNRREYDMFTTPVPLVDQQAVERWREGLEAAAIRIGAAAPELRVLALPTANTVSFATSGGKVAVGVTEEALLAPLSYEEVGAVMAHELAHISMGRYVRKPLLTPAFCVGVGIVALAISIVSMFVLGETAFLFVCLLVVVTIGSFAWVVMGRNPLISNPMSNMRYTGKPVKEPTELFEGAGYEADIVADSVAAKIISEPQALAGAIEKMAGLGKASPVTPAQDMIYDYLFCGPFRAWQPKMPFSLVKPSLAQQSGYVDRMQKNIDFYLESRRRLIVDRLENLKVVEAGIWRAFDQPTASTE